MLYLRSLQQVAALSTLATRPAALGMQPGALTELDVRTLDPCLYFQLLKEQVLFG